MKGLRTYGILDQRKFSRSHLALMLLGFHLEIKNPAASTLPGIAATMLFYRRAALRLKKSPADRNPKRSRSERDMDRVDEMKKPNGKGGKRRYLGQKTPFPKTLIKGPAQG